MWINADAREPHILKGLMAASDMNRVAPTAGWRPEMLATKMAVAISVGTAALLLADAAYAQRNRPAPRSYDSAQSWPRESRFTPEEQKIIDQITANDWRNGR